METSKYKFYMAECDASWGILYNTKRDLEVDFKGLRYAKCEGIDTVGKPRVYTETYADSDTLRVYMPSPITNEATKVTFTFYFFGEKRRETYHSFIDFVRGGKRAYWDSARKRKFYFVVTDEIKPATEMWYGSNPYLELRLTVQNIKGYTENI